MSPNELTDLFSLIDRLKRTKRSGWVNHGVNSPESVADHSFGLSVSAIALASYLELDISKVALISIIHDLGESIIGDIISPEDRAGSELKYQKEYEAIKSILSRFKNKDELLELWLDFEHGKTKEGRFVKELDKVEMCLQALSYEKEQRLDLSEFFTHTESRLSNPDLIELFNYIKEQRN